MVVTLPFVLLLLDFWPLKRTATPGLFLEKIPFFALAALECVATLWAQRGANSVVSFGILPFSARIANALVSCVLYLWKMLWPVDLALPYPYSHIWTFWPAAGAGTLLLLISVGAILRARQAAVSHCRLALVFGNADAGDWPGAGGHSTHGGSLQLRAVDRGFHHGGLGRSRAWTRWPRPGLVFGAVVAGALGFLLAGAEVQLQYWRNSVTLFSHAVAVTRDNILAEYNLAEALARQGDEAQAVVHYQRALAIEPNRVEAHYNSQTQAHYNLGLIFRARKQWAEAEAQFRACLRENPNLARARHNLDAVLREMSNDKARMPK